MISPPWCSVVYYPVKYQGCIDYGYVVSRDSLKHDVCIREDLVASLPCMVMEISFNYSLRVSLVDACGGYIKATNGTIQSPSFPAAYPMNKRCIWQLMAPADYRITLNFTYFELEGNNVRALSCRLVLSYEITLETGIHFSTACPLNSHMGVR